METLTPPIVGAVPHLYHMDRDIDPGFFLARSVCHDTQGLIALVDVYLHITHLQLFPFTVS